MSIQGQATDAPIDPGLDPGWKRELASEFQEPYFAELKAFLLSEKAAGRTFYPPGKLIFNALDTTPFDQVRVVILGQDPYHGRGQAMGLSFSVPPGVKPPPSLVNIFKELHADLGAPVSLSGDLTPWARQGVLLLNATLTVGAGQAASHHGHGWERFTDAVIRRLNDDRDRLVFVLWGKNAQEKGAIVDPRRHLVLKAAHPSPYSAANGFFGSRPFSRTNAYLREHGKPEIDWRLP